MKRLVRHEKWYSSCSIHSDPVIRQPGDIISLKTISRRWWSIPATGFNSILQVPVSKFETLANTENPNHSFILRHIVLPSDIFGVPIRKDVIHRVYWWYRRAMAGYQERLQLYKWEWPGSNKKARPILNIGLSKMGRRKAPGRWEGSYARPVRPKDFRQKLARKVRYLGTKCMLSAKFAQNQLKVVDSFSLLSHKTKHVVDYLRNVLGLRCNGVLLVHAEDIDETEINDNFRWACANIPQIRRERVESLNVYLLLKYRELVLTEKALAKLIDSFRNLEKRWAPKCATPDGKPVDVSKHLKAVPGWNREWLEKREKLKASNFRQRDYWIQNKSWQWNYASLKGPLKIPRIDEMEGFKVKDFTDRNSIKKNKEFLFSTDNNQREDDDDIAPLIFVGDVETVVEEKDENNPSTWNLWNFPKRI